MENSIERKTSVPLKGVGGYAVSFGVIAAVLYATGFPLFLLFFVAALSFFIWKAFSADGRHETRSIFEFYLSANAMLRDDGRRWYGFEIQEAIVRGEKIIHSMSAAPPLVYFALGALYQKLDDHSSAVRNLGYVVESVAGESSIVFPTGDLREYVSMLRKIERNPAEAPLTYSAIRSLERARKNKTASLLEHSRGQLEAAAESQDLSQHTLESIVDPAELGSVDDAFIVDASPGSPRPEPVVSNRAAVHDDVRNHNEHGSRADRKTISEVLHDIYEDKVQ